MAHRWKWTKKEALRNTSHTVCCFVYVTDEMIIPEPSLGLDPLSGVKVAEGVYYTVFHM